MENNFAEQLCTGLMQLLLSMQSYGWKRIHALLGEMDGQWWMVLWSHFMQGQVILVIPGMIASLTIL